MNIDYSTYEMLGSFFGVIIGVLLIVGIVSYIIAGISLSTLAKNNGYENKSFWAWIPILNLFLIAQMAGDEGITQFSGIQLMWFVMISGFLAEVPYIGVVLALLGVIASVIIVIDLYNRIGIDNAVIWAILGTFIPFIHLIIIFTNRDRIFQY